MHRTFWAAAFLISQLSTSTASACSAFAGGATADIKVMGKSFDWMMGHGIALINKRNVQKTGFIRNSADAPAAWTSKYGSVTFTQTGREFPLSGLNEKGLAVEILWDFDNEGPNGKGALPALNEAQWIQYILDLSADVKEAVRNAQTVKIKKIYAEVHFIACDKTGACATFEFKKDQVIINEISDANLKVLTNSAYSNGVNFVQDYIGFGGKNKIPYGSYKSLDRFVILAAQLPELNQQTSLNDAVSRSFAMLRTVRNTGTSVWNIVHDLKNNTSHFKRMFEASKTMITHLDQFDLSCKTPVKILDIESGLDGDVTQKYSNYDASLNRATVELTGQGLGIDKATVDAVANYPETTRCTEN